MSWITSTLPDSDMTVLMRLEDNEYPVWPGFHDGEHWRSSDGTIVQGPIRGWMHLEDAARAIDQPSEPKRGKR